MCSVTDAALRGHSAVLTLLCVRGSVRRWGETVLNCTGVRPCVALKYDTEGCSSCSSLANRRVRQIYYPPPARSLN